MTDIDQLARLAAKINAKTSPNIRAYALAQAAATGSQEAAIRAAAADIESLRAEVEVLRGSGTGVRDGNPPAEDPPIVTPPSPPTGSTGIIDGEGQMLIRYGSAAVPATMSNYAVVVLSPYRGDYGDPAAIRAEGPTKVLMYKAGPDMRNVTGSGVPSQAVRFETDTGLTLDEAETHDAPGDRWICTTNGSTRIDQAYGYANYCGNVGNPNYQAQWCARVLEQLEAENWDGLFIDNVVVQAPQGWPYEMGGTQAGWTAAMLSFMNYVYPYFQSRGYIVGTNSNYFVGGDSTSDSGTGVAGWWASLDGLADILHNEWNAMRSAVDGPNRPEGTAAWYEFWQQRRLIQSQAQTQGQMGVLSGGMTSLNSATARYVRGTAMLTWDGVGVCCAYVDPTGAISDLWTGAAAVDLGSPVEAYTTTNGVYIRQYQTSGGSTRWVAVNPTSGAKTVSVGGTNRTIASADAYLGA